MIYCHSTPLKIVETRFFLLFFFSCANIINFQSLICDTTNVTFFRMLTHMNFSIDINIIYITKFPGFFTKLIFSISLIINFGGKKLLQLYHEEYQLNFPSNLICLKYR